MNVHAGLDEAGYGPMLGPLTIGFSAFRRAGTLDWSTLPDAVSDAPGDDRDRLVVTDSKKVFRRGSENLLAPKHHQSLAAKRLLSAT